MWLVPLALETLLTTSMSRDLLLSSTPLHTQPPPTPNLWETERQGADCTSPPAERSPGALGGANSLFNSSIRSDFGVLEVAKSARRARCLRKKPGKRVQRELRKFQAGPQPAGKGFPEGRGAERRGDLESTHHPKPGCKGRELRVVGSEKEKKKKRQGAGEATGKWKKEKAKSKRWEAEFSGGLSVQHLGRGSGTKLRLQVRRALGVVAERALLGSQSGLGMPGAPAPGARSRAPLTFARAARTHFRGLRAGGAGPSWGTWSGSPR